MKVYNCWTIYKMVMICIMQKRTEFLLVILFLHCVSYSITTLSFCPHFLSNDHSPSLSLVSSSITPHYSTVPAITLSSTILSQQKICKFYFFHSFSWAGEALSLVLWAIRQHLKYWCYDKKYPTYPVEFVQSKSSNEHCNTGTTNKSASSRLCKSNCA